MKDQTAEILFGGDIPFRRIDLAKAVGVSPLTIDNWKKDPGTIPKRKLDILIRCCRLTDEQILALHGRKA